MLADGTLTIKADSMENSVAKRVASLPSSSNNPKQTSRSSQVVSEGEGVARPPKQIEDVLTISSTAKEEDATLATPISHNNASESGHVKGSESIDLQAEKVESLSQEEPVLKGSEADAEESPEHVAEDIAEKLRKDDSLSLKFSQDEETGVELFQLVEKETGNVVRQVPAEDILKFMKKFNTVSGLLFSEQA